MQNKKMLYVRSGPYKVNIKNYNLQEIGFSKQLCNNGFDCDILYYSDENRDECIYEKDGKKVTILWRKGIRILRSGIYPQILKKKFLSQYDFIIATEYSQIMTVLLSRLSNNVVVYNGPYYNLFKIPICEKIYDKLFVRRLNRDVRKIMVKSELAREYLERKGFNNIETLGVGLDIDVFERTNEPSEKVNELKRFMKENKCILYIGSLIERKNFRFMLQVFEKINKKNSDIKFIVIGNGKKSYIEKSLKSISESSINNIKFVDKIDNKYLKDIYTEADVFILPSKEEIFGMVLLEAMYFGVPVVTSLNGGSSTLINRGINGIIIEEFNVDMWANEVLKICLNKDYSDKLRINSQKTIKNNFTWDKIIKKILIKIN